MNAKSTSDPGKPADDVRKPRSDGEQSRERLRLAAMRLFAERGYANTSTREIALAAHANVAAISYYYGDKAGLYRAIRDSVCVPPAQNIALFDQPHFTLAQAIRGFYQQMMAPLLNEDGSGPLLLRLWLREKLEPTGLWDDEIVNSIKPEHEAMARVLARHLGLPVDGASGGASIPDAAHHLTYAIAALPLHLMIARDIVSIVTPQLLAGPDALERWLERLVDYAQAMVHFEKSKLKG
ncbi:CerR family C-terminal domain-containing protein [Oxalobacteraceae bacterium A2-2]